LRQRWNKQPLEVTKHLNRAVMSARPWQLTGNSLYPILSLNVLILTHPILVESHFSFYVGCLLCFASLFPLREG